MAVSRRKLLACLLGLTAVRLSESLTIATSSSNTPPFSLVCSMHYLCRDGFQNLVSVQSVIVNVDRPGGIAKQCMESEISSIRSQAQTFLNDCGRGGDRMDSLTLKSDCIAQARGSVDIEYNCLSAAITVTTPVNDATGDGAVSTWNQQQGGESSSQTTVGATAAAVVLTLTACSVAGMVLVCWRSGLFCFAARNASRSKATAPPSDSTRISAAERQPAGRLHYASTTLVQQQSQHGLPTPGNQRTNFGAYAPSSPAVLRYTSITEQEDHCYEALPGIEDALEPSNDQPVIYDEAAISSSPEPPSHFLGAQDSAGFDAAYALRQEGDSNLYFTVEPPAMNETGGVYSNPP